MKEIDGDSPPAQVTPSRPDLGYAERRGRLVPAIVGETDAVSSRHPGFTLMQFAPPFWFNQLPKQYSDKPYLTRVMRMIKMERLCLRIVCALLASLPLAAQASDAVRIVVPFAQGDASDLMARIIAQPLSEKLNRPVNIHNHYGAGGIVGTQDVVRSKTDGLTLVLGSVSNMSMNTACRGERLGYVPSSALRPVAMLARAPVIVAVTPDSGVQQFGELVERFNAQPGLQTYASSGLCSYTDFMGRYITMRAGVDVVPMPYRGGHDAIQAVMSGEVDVAITELPNAMRDVQAGRLKPLAASLQGKLANTPSFEDIGFAPLDAAVWYGFFVPAETPSREARTMQKAIQQIANDPGVQRQLEELGAEPYNLVGPEIFREVVNFTRAVEGHVNEMGMELE